MVNQGVLTMMGNRDVVILGRGKSVKKFPGNEWRKAIFHFLEEVWSGKIKPHQCPAILFGFVELQMDGGGKYHLYLRPGYEAARSDYEATLIIGKQNHANWSRAEVHDGLADFAQNDETRAIHFHLLEGLVKLSKVSQRDEYRCQVTHSIEVEEAQKQYEEAPPLPMARLHH